MNLRNFLRSCPPEAFGRERDYPGWPRCDECGALVRSDFTACSSALCGSPRPAPAIRLYATVATNYANLEEMARHGIALLCSPQELRKQLKNQFRPRWIYGLDNGAWSAHTNGTEFDARAFLDMVGKIGAEAEWIVLPDIVAGGLDSLALSMSWLDRMPVRVRGVPLLLPLQDGMERRHVVRELDARKAAGGFQVGGFFLGGTTEYKLNMLASWGELAKERGLYYHVGRVNTQRRIGHCIDAGAHSCDGTSVTLYGKTAPTLAGAASCDARPQLRMFK